MHNAEAAAAGGASAAELHQLFAVAKNQQSTSGRCRRRSRRRGGEESDYKLNCQVQVGTMQRHTQIRRYTGIETKRQSTKEKGFRLSQEIPAANCALNCVSLCSMVTELNQSQHILIVGGGTQKGVRVGKHSQAIYHIQANSLGTFLCRAASLPRQCGQNGTKKANKTSQRLHNCVHTL